MGERKVASYCCFRISELAYSFIYIKFIYTKYQMLDATAIIANQPNATSLSPALFPAGALLVSPGAIEVEVEVVFKSWVCRG